MLLFYLYCILFVLSSRSSIVCYDVGGFFLGGGGAGWSIRILMSCNAPTNLYCIIDWRRCCWRMMTIICILLSLICMNYFHWCYCSYYIVICLFCPLRRCWCLLTVIVALHSPICIFHWRRCCWCLRTIIFVLPSLICIK